MKKIFNLFVLVTLLALTFGASGVTPALAFPGRTMTVCPPGSQTFTTGTLNVGAGGGGTTDADVMFVFDTTGSMGSVINSAKAGAIDIMNNVKATFPAATFGVVEYKDYGDGLPYALRQALTADGTAVSNAIAPLTAGGGGDFPESAGAALSPSYDALNPWGWKGGTTGKFVVLFTDAPATEADIDARLTAMNGAGVTLLVVASGSYDYWLAKAALTGDKAAVIAYIQSTFVDDVTGLILGAATRTLAWSLSDPAYNTWVSSTPTSYDVPPEGGAYTFEMTVTVPGGTTVPSTHNFTINYTVDGTAIDSEALTVNAQCYTVTFDGNGSTVGSMAPQVAGVPTALTLNAFTWPGHTFAGWNTAANGSGTPYADGELYDFAADITLYAQWTPRLEPLSPSGTLVAIPNPTFVWSILPTATSYRLAVYSLAETSYLILDNVATSYCNASQCSYPSPINLSNGDYKFKVLANTSGGPTPYSDWMNFTITGVVIPPPANPPTLIAPNTTVNTHRPTFQWNEEQYATFYRLAVYSYAVWDYIFVEDVYPVCTAGVCTYTPTTWDLANGNYGFKLRSRNSSGYSAFNTSLMKFSVSSNLPVAPTLIAPSGTVGVNPPAFEWNEVSGATSYRLLVYSIASGSYVIDTNVLPTACSGGVCTYTPASALADGGYKFKLSTTNAFGKSGYSAFMSFAIR